MWRWPGHRCWAGAASRHRRFVRLRPDRTYDPGSSIKPTGINGVFFAERSCLYFRPDFVEGAEARGLERMGVALPSERSSISLAVATANRVEAASKHSRMDFVVTVGEASARGGEPVYVSGGGVDVRNAYVVADVPACYTDNGGSGVSRIIVVQAFAPDDRQRRRRGAADGALAVMLFALFGLPNDRRRCLRFPAKPVWDDRLTLPLPPHMHKGRLTPDP